MVWILLLFFKEIWIAEFNGDVRILTATLEVAFVLVNSHQSPKYLCIYKSKNRCCQSKGGCKSVHFVDWCIMGLVIKAKNDWRDVWRPSSSIASQLPPFLLYLLDPALWLFLYEVDFKVFVGRSYCSLNFCWRRSLTSWSFLRSYSDVKLK